MATKRIPIEQLIPGMFIIEMDVPWYRTPFLSHKRLIKDLQTIQLMKQHGIRMVTIDTSKGADLPSAPSTTTQHVASQSAPNPDVSAPPDPTAERSPETKPDDHSIDTSKGADLPSALSTTTQHAASQQAPNPDVSAPPNPKAERSPEAKSDSHPATAIYAQAQEAVERIFEDLERGIPPSPEATKAIVSSVLGQVLSDRAAMATQVAIQKIKQFDRSLTTHALDTCILSLVVAIESGLDQTTQEQVGMGALLHDAGYIRLPRNLVRKREECHGQDKTLLEQHCKLGVALLSEQPGMHEDVLRIVREHHERTNGSGFPAKLGNDQISRLAQIVGIVDFYDGMVSRHGTRPAMIPHDAVRQLFLAGEQGLFEKALVELMIRSIGVYPVGSLVRLNTGEQAVVVGVNPQQRLKPLVKVTTDPQGGSYATPIDIDLATPSPHNTVRTVLRVLDPSKERVNIGIHLDQGLSRAA